MRWTLSLALILSCSCTADAPEPAPPATPAPQPAVEAAPSDDASRIVPTANPNSVPPDDRGAVANSAEALASIQALKGDPQGLLEAYRQGASRAVTMDLAPFDLQPDSVIADIGAGTGALPVRLLAEGVPFAKLYAVELDQASLDILGAALEASELPAAADVELVRSRRDDVTLPPGSVDRVIVIDTGIGCIPTAASGHQLPPMRLQMSAGLLGSMRAAVQDDARVHVLRPWNAPPVPPFACPAAWVEQAFADAGFRLVEALPQTPPEGEEPEHLAFHLVFAPGEPAG